MTDTKRAKDSPTRASTAIAWVKDNLFSSLANTTLTLITGTAFVFFLYRFLRWVLLEAQWAVVPANIQLLMVGPYPKDELWRVWSGVVALSLALGFQWGKGRRTKGIVFSATAVATIVLVMVQPGEMIRMYGPVVVASLSIGFWSGRLIQPSGKVVGLLWTIAFFVFVFLLGADLGHGGVTSNLWGGLLLTLIISSVSIVTAFPLGVLLAIGRTSALPIVSILATAYIELVRSVPLLVVLFLAQLFVPLFLPGVHIPKVLRAIIGISLFQAAYVAENVRGGLQSVDKGQPEAARALGLNGFQALWFIVLPQALKAVIPANTGQFIQLFKETSLVSIVGLTDLLGIGNVIVANPNWLGLYKEVYITLAVIYAMFSYAMSSAGYALEKRSRYY